MTLEIFRRSFPDRFFPRYVREAYVEEFISFCEGCMSVLHYSLRFAKFSRCAPFLASNPTDKMSNFPTGVSIDMVEE